MPVMHNIDHFNLRSFDLNLLVAFDALISEGSVTRAAEKLRIGQPAMSHSLATLRLLLGDELFVRIGQKMQPTARAQSLAGPIREALHQAQAALKVGLQFDPRTEKRVFRIGVSDEMAQVLLPALMAYLAQKAPNIGVLARDISLATLEQLLSRSEIDVAVGVPYVPQGAFRGERLFEAQACCCFRPDLIGLTGAFDDAAYFAGRHAVFSQVSDISGCVGEIYRNTGHMLDVGFAAPAFVPLLAVAAQAPLIATVPARIAQLFAPKFGLTIGHVPIASGFSAAHMVWAGHGDHDVALSWLRDCVRASLEGK
ncbi:LysR family transcriptional regulator [Thalassospira marina]|uniref:LysR family transcriptional regulator n=2 Tax=Thalassospira marina TaxID=2048283 RepID=A0ABN5FLD1_9PROT|nr:LysR family transcriptional regulator [Thalassospira marina]